jgi:hypothetical protein
LNPSATSAGGARQRSALAELARTQPEAPFLFYRNARGHFRWWSYSTASTFLDEGEPRAETLSVKGVVVEREAVELLGGYLRLAIGDGAESPATAEIPGPEPGAPRDVWISWRSLTDPDALALARWAILSGTAILVEPGPALHPELFAWARPTVVSGTVEELGALADQVEALAPRFLRRRWLRQRGERLRLVLVEGEPAPEALRRVRERWRSLLPSCTARIELLDVCAR